MRRRCSELFPGPEVLLCTQLSHCGSVWAEDICRSKKAESHGQSTQKYRNPTLLLKIQEISEGTPGFRAHYRGSLFKVLFMGALHSSVPRPLLSSLSLVLPSNPFCCGFTQAFSRELSPSKSLTCMLCHPPSFHSRMWSFHVMLQRRLASQSCLIWRLNSRSLG